VELKKEDRTALIVGNLTLNNLLKYINTALKNLERYEGTYSKYTDEIIEEFRKVKKIVEKSIEIYQKMLNEK
jgi:hypothetical protein